MKRFLILCLCFLSSKTYASEKSFYDKPSVFSLLDDTDRPRSVIWPQLMSFVLPGFDQLWEGQNNSGVIYAGLAIAGYSYAQDRRTKMTDEDFHKADSDPYTSRNNTYRAYQMGLQLPITVGGLSAYHSFRSAVRSREKTGDFNFLESEETIPELLYAPLHFEYMLRPTTFIPLLIAGTLAYVQNAPYSLAADNMQATHLRSSDYFYSAVPSYGAGVGEEALFRGWMLPMLRYEMNSSLWANLTTSTVFALAHLGTVNVPVIQALFGYHLGYVTMKNHWTLSESIFIHTWWDVIAFLSSYAIRDRNDPSRVNPVLTFPIQIQF